MKEPKGLESLHLIGKLIKKSESGGRDGLVESEFGIDKKKLVIYLGWVNLKKKRKSPFQEI